MEENAKKWQIRKDTTISWKKTVTKAAEDSEKMWRLTEWVRTKALEPPAAPQFPPLKDRQGRIHSTKDANAEILAHHFFPLPVPADLTDLEGHMCPPKPLASQEVTAEEVVCHLMEFHYPCYAS